MPSDRVFIESHGEGLWHERAACEFLNSPRAVEFSWVAKRDYDPCSCVES